jgi:hypothetical protein
MVDTPILEGSNRSSVKPELAELANGRATRDDRCFAGLIGSRWDVAVTIGLFYCQTGGTAQCGILAE